MKKDILTALKLACEITFLICGILFTGLFFTFIVGHCLLFLGMTDLPAIIIGIGVVTLLLAFTVIFTITLWEKYDRRKED